MVEYVIVFLLEFLIIFFVFKSILHVSITNSLVRVLIAIVAMVLWLVYISASDMPIPNTFIIIPTIFVLFCEKWYFKLCGVIVCSFAINILTNVSFYLYCMVTGTAIGNLQIHSLTDGFMLLLGLAGIFLLSKKIPKEDKPLRNLTGKGYVLLALVIVVDFFLSTVSSLLFLQNLNVYGRYFLVVAIFIMIAMSVVLLLFYFRLQHYHSVLQQNHLVNLKMLQFEEQHYQEMQKKNMDIRAFRHDYNSHVMAMQGLVQSEDIEGLKKYVNHLAKVKEQVYYLSTNNPVADAIVNYFYEKLPANTTFQMYGKVPKNVFLDDSDLCILLSNLLKNAKEAVDKVDGTSEKHIYLSYDGNEQYLIIRIENSSKPYQKEQLLQLNTLKSDKVNHGFGLKNVKAIVKKYDGKLDLEYCEGVFTSAVYLRSL